MAENSAKVGEEVLGAARLIRATAPPGGSEPLNTAARTVCVRVAGPASKANERAR